METAAFGKVSVISVAVRLDARTVKPLNINGTCPFGTGGPIELWSYEYTLPTVKVVILFVPEPEPVLPPEPVVKSPPVSPVKKSPVGLLPSTLQIICLFAGNGGTGVQVRTVFCAFQLGVVVRSVNVVPSKKVAVVAVGSIGSLNVNTTGAEGEMPVAKSGGTVETMVGCALRV